MENNNYKKWRNIRKGSLNIEEVDDVQIKPWSPYTGETSYALEFKIGATNVMAIPNGIPCKVSRTSEINEYCQQYASGSNGSYVGTIKDPGTSASQLYINIPANTPSYVDLILTRIYGGYILLPLYSATINAQPNWSESSSTSLSFIANKPSVEVTGNKLSSSQTIDTYKTNTTKYPTTKAVYDFVTSSLPDVSGKEDKTNKVAAWSATPSDTNYPSEKLVYDTIGDVESLLAAL